MFYCENWIFHFGTIFHDFEVENESDWSML